MGVQLVLEVAHVCEASTYILCGPAPVQNPALHPPRFHGRGKTRHAYLQPLTSHPLTNSRAPISLPSHMQAEIKEGEGASEHNHLQVLAPLGQGAFGVVYLGTWRGLRVAVKTMVIQSGAGQSCACSPFVLPAFSHRPALSFLCWLCPSHVCSSLAIVLSASHTALLFVFFCWLRPQQPCHACQLTAVTGVAHPVQARRASRGTA